MERKRRNSLIALIILTALFLCGCSTSAPVKEKYKLDEIYEDSLYGFYVKDGTDFYPVKQPQGNPEDNFMWSYGSLGCPKVTKDTPLVAVFGSNQDMPNEYYIEKYRFLCYTIGANVSIGEDGQSMWMSTSNLCEGSNIQMALDGQDISDPCELDTVNGEKYLSNIDTEVNILTGLEKNKYYDLEIFSGTRNLKATICADTAVYKKKGHTDLSYPLTKTYDKYFIVNIPEDLGKGYYSVNGEGFFRID